MEPIMLTYPVLSSTPFPQKLGYTDMYAAVDPIWLLSNFGKSVNSEEILEAETRYQVKEIISPLSHLSNCISVSLFCKNNDSRAEKPLPIPSMDEEGKWYKKYFDCFNTFLRDFHQTPFFNKWKVRVYLEPDILPLISRLKGNRVEYYVMAESSVGASPGALWRYLALADKSLGLVFVSDIDEGIDDKIPFIKAFLLDKQKAMGRLLPSPSTNSFLVHHDWTAKNYATVLGSRVAARPNLFPFDVDKAIQAWVRMRIRALDNETPWKVLPSDCPTPYNEHNIHTNHPFGWGNHHHIYCFDERFLKHVLYPFSAQNGLLQTWATYKWWAIRDLNEEIKADMEYLFANPDNTVVLV